MKKLGLIGGVGPESTIPYYRGIIYGVQKQLNKPFFPPLVIESLSSFEVIRMSSQKDREGLTKYLLKGIQNLAAACAEAKRQGLKKIGLLGTAATMEDNYFKIPFEKAGIEIKIPKQTERDYIADHILSELELGIVKEETVNHFVEIVEEMSKIQNIDAVILGCTELPLIFEGRNLSIPSLDTMQLHIQALIKTILEE